MEKTWPVFDNLFSANDGVWGGCWCTFYQKTGTFDSNTYGKNRKATRKLVSDGVAHGASPAGFISFLSGGPR